MHKKDLYFGKCLDELKPHYECLDVSLVKNRPLQRWV